MDIFFDTDNTWLGADGTVRPGTHELMRSLTEAGHRVYVWSGVGVRWPEVRLHQLAPFVSDCFVKPLDNFIEALDHLGLPVTPDLVIDDYPEVPAGLGGIWVRPYLLYDPTDREMERVHRLILVLPAVLTAGRSRQLPGYEPSGQSRQDADRP